MESFVRRMIAHLRTDFSEEVAARNLRGEDFEPLVRRGIANARGYGVQNEGDLQLFLECMVMLGPSFDKDGARPWAAQILQRADLAGHEKMDQIGDHLVFGTEGRR